MGFIWEEADVAAQNRSEWRQSVAECMHLDAGWIKVKVTLTAEVSSWHILRNVINASFWCQ